MKKCKKCGKRFFVLSTMENFMNGRLASDYCRTCEKQYPELTRQQEQSKQQLLTETLNKIGKIQFPQLYERKETVVLLVEGAAGLQLAVQCANPLGYELMHTSSAMSMWTPFTKYTLIFKKKSALEYVLSK